MASKPVKHQLPLPMRLDVPSGDGVPPEWRPIVRRVSSWRQKPTQLQLDLNAGQLQLFEGQ